VASRSLNNFLLLLFFWLLAIFISEYALKLFIDDDEDDDDNEDSDNEEESSSDGTIDIGALREISILRLLRSTNSHRNIVPIVDVKPVECGEEDEVGAGTQGYLGMAMPVYHDGTLARVIDDGSAKAMAKADKVRIAHGLLSGVAFLHRNGIIHRDIKSDNCMMMSSPSGGDDGPSCVLIDFSLAKLVNGAMYEGTAMPNLRFGDVAGDTHTPSAGTPTYRAPEVINLEPYGLKSDCWSVGVVLLELLSGQSLQVEKDGQAVRLVRDMVTKLPDQPFANLVRGLLEVNPEQRLSAEDALQSKVFDKFGLSVTDETRKIVDLGHAFEEDYVDCLDEGGDGSNTRLSTITNVSNKKGGGSTKTGKIDPKLVRRQKQIDKVCHALNCAHPLTPHAALTYATHMLELDETIFDGPGKTESQGLLDCVVLAAKMFEENVPDCQELDECENGLFGEWTLEEFIDSETTIWMLMDYCLLPRRLVDWA